jgi:hypothetical protein
MGVIMVGRPRDFRHGDVVRAIRAAKAAGIDSPSVRIRTPGGTEYFVGGGSVEAPASKVRGKAASSVGKGKENRAPLAAGGKAHMLGKQAADTAPAGRTAKTKSAAAPKEASGGMPRAAKPA